MIQRLIQVYKRPISLYLDYHGHSRKRNFFLYGCSNKNSWKKSDKRLSDNVDEFMVHITNKFNFINIVEGFYFSITQRFSQTTASQCH